jgi:hypothetical protein
MFLARSQKEDPGVDEWGACYTVAPFLRVAVMELLRRLVFAAWDRACAIDRV